MYQDPFIQNPGLGGGSGGSSFNPASPGAIGGTTPAAGTFTSVTDSGLTSGRVTTAGTGGLLQDFATFLYGNAASVGGGPQITLGTGATTSIGWVGGSQGSGVAAWWTTAVTPAGTNYSFAASSTTTFLNASGTIQAFVNGTNTWQTNSVGIFPPSAGSSSLGTASTGWSKLYLDFTNTATVGNVTINKASGRVNLAAAGTTLTLTNSVITANSHVFLNSDGAPGNVVAVQFYAVPGAGSCTINAVPAVTNQTAIDFLVVNAD